LPGLIDRPGGAFADQQDFEQILPMIDGLFLTGSISNVYPQLYGKSLEDPNSPADPARDHVALRLIRAAIAHGIPVMGVCRGFQEINVAMGGTLHQAVHNIPGFNDHRENKTLSLAEQYGPAHSVQFTPDGALHLFTGMQSTEVNSLHGQGVDRLAEGLVVDAVAQDGLIEAFRGKDTNHFLLGLQWHPEWQFRDNPVSVSILRAFGNATKAYRSNRK